MSWYQMHRCVYDWVRAGEVNSADGGDGRAGFDVASYELSDEERKAFDTRTSRPSTTSGCTRCCSTATPARPASPGTTTGSLEPFGQQEERRARWK